MDRSILSDKAKADLELSMISYLLENGYQNTADALKKESQQMANEQYSGLLQKKWVLVTRLQKRCLELETQLSKMEKEMQDHHFSRRVVPDFTPLPSWPPRHSLQSHKKVIKYLSVHPTYTHVATASEDQSIKIFDYESSQLVGGCGGHDAAVTAIHFNKQGTVLASCGKDMLLKTWDVENDFKLMMTYYGHHQEISLSLIHI